ncbi:unnamed protein product [Choristocarpus tenellus]
MSAALGVLETVVSLLRSSTRPYGKRIEMAVVSLLQGPDDGVRHKAACVLSSLGLCGEGGTWSNLFVRVLMEAHRYVIFMYILYFICSSPYICSCFVFCKYLVAVIGSTVLCGAEYVDYFVRSV